MKKTLIIALLTGAFIYSPVAFAESHDSSEESEDETSMSTDESSDESSTDTNEDESSHGEEECGE